MGLTTELIKKQIGDPMEAPVVMGQDVIVGNRRQIPILLEPGQNPCNLWFSIPEGFHSIISRFDKQIGIADAGIYFPVHPGLAVCAMVPKQFFTYEAPVKECPTKDNIMVEVDVSVVFHIKEAHDDVYHFVNNLGPNQFNMTLRNFQQEEVRSMTRMKLYTSIYDLMDTEELELPEQKEDDPEVGEIVQEEVVTPGLPGEVGLQMTPLVKKDKTEEGLDKGAADVNRQLEESKRRLNDKFSQWGVEFLSITITNVALPPDLRDQMENATSYDSKNRCAAAEQEFDIMVIRDNEKREQASQKLDEELKELESKNQQRLAHEKKITSVLVAETNAQVAKIHEETNSDVRQITSDSQLKVATLEKERDLVLAQASAEADAEITKVEAELESFVVHHRAEAQMVVAQCEAEALQLRSQAEAVAAVGLLARRDYEAKMSQLRIIKNLALNEQVSLSGNNKKSAVASMLAARNAASVMGLSQ